MDEQPKIVYLMHPELNVPAEAVQQDYWYNGGRAVGLRLRFADGDRCLTYKEIRRLRQALPASKGILAA